MSILLAILLTVLAPFNILILLALRKVNKENKNKTSKFGLNILVFVLVTNYLLALGGWFLW